MRPVSPLVALGAALASAGTAEARDVLVHSQAEYRDAAARVQPGDTILLADGEWKDFAVVLRGEGLPGKPIRLAAQTPGKVALTGLSNLKLSGRNLEVANLVFRDGHSPDDEVVAFRTSSKAWADDSRVTGIVIDSFNQPDRRKEDHWVSIYGAGNRVDHGHFEGKVNGGAMLVVVRQKGMPLENRARIDHNYFGPRPPLGSNGGETIRIGTSTESGSDALSIVEDNIFEHCDGEVEIVSVKSGGNILRRNLFLESQGSLVLRHGSGNLVEDNVFLGHGVPLTGGVRIINERQTIRNNYMEGLAGRSFTSAIALMNGVPNSPVFRYMPVRDVAIERNTILDAAQVTIGAGADAERAQPPADTRIRGNLISGAGGSDPVRIESNASGVTFDGNILAGSTSATPGISARAVVLERAANGLLYPKDRSLAVGASRTLKPIDRASVGVAWYKPAHRSVAFGSGKTTRVAAGQPLAPLFAKGLAGDTVQLASGRYSVAAPIVIDRPLTLAAAPGTATVEMAGDTLFRIENGGALRLDGVTIDGAHAPKGAAAIRTSAQPMTANYRIEIARSQIARLAGDVIATTPATLAGDITIIDSDFDTIGGAVIAGHAETGTKGWYGTEQVRINDSRFTNVATLADLFRGGTDESTFGPRFTLTGSTITDGGALLLSGVQETEVRGNRFVRGSGITLTHSVGAPTSRIDHSQFVATPDPVVNELHYSGPPRAILSDNVRSASL